MDTASAAPVGNLWCPVVDEVPVMPIVCAPSALEARAYLRALVSGLGHERLHMPDADRWWCQGGRVASCYVRARL